MVYYYQHLNLRMSLFGRVQYWSASMRAKRLDVLMVLCLNPIQITEIISIRYSGRIDWLDRPIVSWLHNLHHQLQNLTFRQLTQVDLRVRQCIGVVHVCIYVATYPTKEGKHEEKVTTTPTLHICRPRNQTKTVYTYIHSQPPELITAPLLWPWRSTGIPWDKRVNRPYGPAGTAASPPQPPPPPFSQTK